MSYKTIRNRTEASFTEKKSEFIGYISPAGTEEEAIGFINEIRAMHRMPIFFATTIQADTAMTASRAVLRVCPFMTFFPKTA